jgi:hypothetical protein
LTCIGEFPFDTQADYAGAVAFLLTLVLRPALKGKTPITLFDKPAPGTGGSLLAEVCARVAIGSVPMSPVPESEAEWRKMVMSTLLEGRQVKIIDNCEGVLESDALAGVVTADFWSDRQLQVSKTPEVPARTVWAVTGNNLQLGRNIGRRCHRVRVDAKVPNPAKRAKVFKHPKLLEYVVINRGKILAAAMILCRAWHVAGRPPGGNTIIVSFEEWSEVVGGILKFAGINGFLSNWTDTQTQADDDAQEWEAFVEALNKQYGDRPVLCGDIERDVTVSACLREHLPNELSKMVQHRPSNEAILESYHVRPQFKHALGNGLKKRVGMIFPNNITIRHAGQNAKTKAKRWTFPMLPAGTAETAETVLNPNVNAQISSSNLSSDETILSNGGQSIDSVPAVSAALGNQLGKNELRGGDYIDGPGVDVSVPADWPEDWREYCEDRAAILVFDEGMRQEDAAKEAIRETRVAMMAARANTSD